MEPETVAKSENKLNPFIDFIANDKSEEKLRDLFEFYDVDGNGLIQRQELIDVLSLCAHEIGLEVDEAHLQQLADAVFCNANLNQSGSITFESLKEVLKTRPCLTSELALAKEISSSGSNQQPAGGGGGGCVLGGKRRFRADPCEGLRNQLADWWELKVSALAVHVPLANKLRWEYISNNLARVNFFLCICVISLSLIIGRIISYWDSGPLVVLARAAGQCLNFYCSIIVLLVCRRSITLLRSHGYSRYLPLDDHIYFHKMLGIFIAFWSLVHTLGHLVNFALVADSPTSVYTYYEYLFTTRPQIGWIGQCACITGWVLLIIITIMSLAQPFSRSLGKFELFYYSHLLYIPFWILLFIHAPRFWIWFLGPFTVFLIEGLVRLKNFMEYFSAEQTTIIKAVPLPSNVVHLVIKKPANFEYNPGDWIYVLIPQIAKYEWHPFTISSAPEQEGVIWLHIRAVGEWTRCLRSYFEGLEDRNHLRKFIKSGQFSMSMDQFAPTSSSLVNGRVTGMQTVDLSVNDSARYLGASRGIKDKLSQFKRKVTALASIPEAECSCETATTDLTSSTFQSSSSTFQSSSSTASSSSLANSNATITNSNPMGVSGESNASSEASSTTSQRMARLPNIKIFIDGPYGSPSSQIFRAEHAVLIATGIGVTPFASILQSIVHHYEKRRQKCPSCAYEFSDTRPPIVCKLRKVDFVWINRDQKSFEWFIKLLAELELAQSHLPPNERFLDIHIYLTAMEPAKTKSIGLQLALYLVHEKNKKDLVTGLRTRTKAGRPNWDNFFEDIREQKRGKVSVFFCGLPQLGRVLHRQCDSFGFKFRKEIF